MSEQPASIAELLQRIDQLESRNAMRDLASDYCHGFDKHDYARFEAIWWEDCEFEIGPPFGAFTGLAGIKRAVQEVLWPAWRETHHLTTNLRVWFDDKDHARGECDVDCMGASPDHQVMIVGASYYDRFERRNKVWKIRKRTVKLHYFNPLPGAQMSPPG